MTKKERESYNQRFKLGIQKAVDFRVELIGHAQVVTACRSAAPMTAESMRDLPRLHEHFWAHGSTDEDHESLSQATHSNPMFTSLLTDTQTLHYGTDPLLGFHLATAYLPLTSDSPLNSSSSSKSHLHKVVESARIEFRTWGESFRKCADHALTLRFFAGEALAFCHTLQHKRATGKNCANFYRRQYSIEPLVLDSQDYAMNGNAPVTFNVIDTSNLADHVGAINILMATTPLMDGSISATLNMESFVRQDKDHEALIDRLLCGHFATVSILFGVFPVEYWTNATTSSNAEEKVLGIAASHMAGVDEHETGQLYNRISWKRPISAPFEVSRIFSPPPIHFDEAELAVMLYNVYLTMFQHEDISKLKLNPNISTLYNNSRPLYHRGTLVAFLSVIKNRVLVSNWDKVIEAFLTLIENDRNMIMSSVHLQELYLHLHLLDVYSVEIFRRPLNMGNRASSWSGMSAWAIIPPVVCVTLKVPRTSLKVFTDLPSKELLTPPVHCLLRSADIFRAGAWQNIFTSIQLSFGEITTSGSRDDNNFSIDVLEDKRGWKGSSPLLISIYVPSWVVLQEAQTTVVGFGIQTTLQTAKTFAKILGHEMTVYKTTLGNEDNVFITRHRPNQKGFPSIWSLIPEKANSDDLCDVARSVITANLDPKTGQITTITGRLNIIAPDLQTALRDGCRVDIIHISPWIIAVVLEKKKQQRLHFPAPVLQAGSKCGIARKSSYVEVEALLSPPLGNGALSHLICPIFPNGQDPVVWNMPRLNLDCLPQIDTTKKKDLDWLNPHATHMWSARERRLREAGDAQKDVRITFKDSLLAMFMQSSRGQGQGAKVFGFFDAVNDSVFMIFIVSCLRLDLSNQTVVLDAVVLPLYPKLYPILHDFIAGFKNNVGQIIVDEDEMKLWKEMLPVFVERCRQWKHRPTCEYIEHSRIPVSFESGAMTICSCGNGTIPKGFITDIPLWNTVSKYGVRVALSPIFAPPFSESKMDLSRLKLAINGASCVKCGKTEKSSSDGNNPGTGGSKLLKCARCLVVRYCSVECQRADWRIHKTICREIRLDASSYATIISKS